ncbi:MAG: DUF1292 domain-containing protein [Clostridia bacterium]|nr:DUF1292 domain-containing protein [Clostridia bacterium]
MDKVITLVGENGENVDFEVIADFEVNETEYAVLLPLDGSDEAVIFKVIEDGDEPILEPIEDEDEFQMASEVFFELMDEE